MQTSARSGFCLTDTEIFFWYSGQKQVATRIGPILALEDLGSGQFILNSAHGKRYRAHLTADQVLEFRRLDSTVKGSHKAAAPRPSGIVKRLAALPQAVPEAMAGIVNLLRAKMDIGLAKPVARKSLLWQGRGTKVQAGPYTISDPLTYFSQGPPSEDEASCIELTLPIGKPVKEPRGALGYWPQYRSMSPEQRANYLAWLAGGRKGPLDDIGYAFVYFYGLERRILIDNRDKNLDVNPVTNEILRLLNVYTFSGSFIGYLSRLIAYTMARIGLEKVKESGFAYVFQESPVERNEDMLALAMAWMIKRAQPLPADWAMRMAGQHPQASRSVVTERAPEQFRALFTQKYSARFGHGLSLKASKRDRNVHYSQPASPSLLSSRQLNPSFVDSVPIPNVLGLQSQFLPLVKIWAECIEELKPLSRQLAKGMAVGTREAYAALPPSLKAQTEHPDKPLWERAVAENTSEEGYVLVPAFRLAAIQGIGQRARLTLKQSATLAETAQAVGFSIEPDARITQRPYGWDEAVALFRPDGESNSPSDQRYVSTALILELAMAVAAADGRISPEETSHITRFLEAQFHLDPAEVRRLDNLKQVFLRQLPSLSRIGKRLFVGLSLTERELLGRFLFGSERECFFAREGDRVHTDPISLAICGIVRPAP
jgi:hypothetical protein